MSAGGIDTGPEASSLIRMNCPLWVDLGLAPACWQLRSTERAVADGIGRRPAIMNDEAVLVKYTGILQHSVRTVLRVWMVGAFHFEMPSHGTAAILCH